MNRYLYVLSVHKDGQWTEKQYNIYPEQEIDEMQKNNQIWKLTIARNPQYKPEQSP